MRWRIGVMLCTITLVSGCAKKAQLDGAACFPEAARGYISAETVNVSTASDTGGPYTIYLDGSASMAGYIRGASAQERPLADLVGMLPGLNGLDHSQVSVVRFDRRFAELAPTDIERMKAEAGYVCPSASPNCDAQESHIDQALARIAKSDPTGLSIIVTDLWLANSDIRTSDGVALSKPLTDMLDSGRAIALYGIESPYSGRVNDLPSKRSDVTARRKHLFVIASGPIARVRAFHEAMRRAPSPTIAKGLGDGTIRYALFTLDPLMPAASVDQPFELTAAGALGAKQFLQARTGVHVQQFVLDKGKALRAQGDAGARWPGVPDTAFLPGTVWLGPTRGTTAIYRQIGEKCAAEAGDWREEGALPGGWESSTRSGYRLDPGELATLPSGRYLLVGRLQRLSLETPNPATQWMRDWSFDSFGETAAVAKPVMPTLNLAETARLLENALQKAAEEKPARVGGFAVAVEVE